jgi:hypothetical protein
MSKVKVEEINKIDLDAKTWWQPQIDKQTFKRLLKEIILKLGSIQFYILVLLY